MLVKIRDDFTGNYGHYRKDLGSVVVMRAGSDPFEMDDDIARERIEQGIVVPAGGAGRDSSTDKPSMKELRERAKELGIKSFGKKAEELQAEIEQAEETGPDLTVEEPI